MTEGSLLFRRNPNFSVRSSFCSQMLLLFTDSGSNPRFKVSPQHSTPGGLRSSKVVLGAEERKKKLEEGLERIVQNLFCCLKCQLIIPRCFTLIFSSVLSMFTVITEYSRAKPTLILIECRISENYFAIFLVTRVFY